MEQLKMEMAGAGRDTKLTVLRGLMECIGPDGKATRPFELRFRGGAPLDIEQKDVVKAVLWLKAQV